MPEIVTIEPRCFRCVSYRPWAEPPDGTKGVCACLEIYTRADSGETCHKFEPAPEIVKQAIAGANAAEQVAPAPMPVKPAEVRAWRKAAAKKKAAKKK